MRRFAELVLHHRIFVAIGWLVLIVAGAVSAGVAVDRMTVDFSMPGQPSTEAAQEIVREFGNGGLTSPYLVTLTAPAGKAVTGNETTVAQAFQAVGKAAPHLRVVDEASSGNKVFRTEDDRTAYAMVFYPASPNPSVQIPTDQLEAALEKATPAGWEAGVTGEDVLALGDAGDTDGASGTPSALVETLFGALGALIVLAFVFASFLALLPMIVALASIMLTFLMLLPFTYAMDVSFIVQFLIMLIGLGVAIDYSLLLVTRWREERDHGRDNHEAVVVAMETAGKAVIFSGVTVAIGLLALVVLPVPFMRSLGIGGALIPLASVLTTLTLTPAILSSIGPKIDWPKIRHENTVSRGWAGWSRGVVKNRWAAAGLALVAMGALVVAFLGIKIGLPESGSLANEGPTYRTLQTLERGGEPTGILTPLQVLTTTEGASSVAEDLKKVEGIADVVVSTDAANERNGKTIVIAIPTHETVNSDSVGPVKQAREVAENNPAVLGVAGIGADQIDFLKAVYGNFPLMLTIIALLTFVLLVRAFRSVLLPLKAVILNLFTLAATYGFMALFWQKGYGSEAIFGIQETGAITFWVPLMVFAFLFGLSMDYEVFILSRMREEYDASGDTNHAVVQGIARTGRLVTSAALILFLAFVALGQLPGTDIKIMATALGFGILLDATIVRSLLVPALVSLFGDWNWWLPDWLARVLRVPQPEPEPEEELAFAE